MLPRYRILYYQKPLNRSWIYTNFVLAAWLKWSLSRLIKITLKRGNPMKPFNWEKNDLLLVLMQLCELRQVWLQCFAKWHNSCCNQDFKPGDLSNWWAIGVNKACRYLKKKIFINKTFPSLWWHWILWFH